MKIKCAIVTAGILTALAAGPAFSQADNSNSRWSPSAFDAWMDRGYSVTYSDRLVRDSYVEQAERRREAIERHERASGMSMEPGYVVVLPDQGSGISPDPSRVGPSSSMTNPTGNELQGENSGGK